MVRGRRWGLLLAQVGLVLAIAVGIWWSFRSYVNGPAGPLPQSIAHLALVSSISGEAALAQVNQMHGVDVGLTEGYVGEYRHEGERLTVWIGVASSPDKAAELVRRMTEGIQDGSATFSHAGARSIAGAAVHMIRGGEGTSYYFQRDRRLIWLTAVSPQPESLLEASLRAWP